MARRRLSSTVRLLTAQSGKFSQVNFTLGVLVQTPGVLQLQLR